jgi:hypothetical protein
MTCNVCAYAGNIQIHCVPLEEYLKINSCFWVGEQRGEGTGNETHFYFLFNFLKILLAYNNYTK